VGDLADPGAEPVLDVVELAGRAEVEGQAAAGLARASRTAGAAAEAVGDVAGGRCHVGDVVELVAGAVRT
jgi:hypothetical protein